MRKIVKNGWLLMLISGLFLLQGCPALVAGGAAVTAGTGTYIYVNGELKTDYHFDYDNVWNACEKVVADMNSVDVIPAKEIDKGTIDAVIENETVHFYIAYKSQNLTTVGIRVGLLGNQLASQRLHDEIAEYLLKK